MKKSLPFFALLLAVSVSSCQQSVNTKSGYRENNDRDQTVDNGYTTTSSRAYTGSATKVEDNNSLMTLDYFLKRSAGVLVTGTGANARVTIHGEGSFVSSNEPIFIINGSQIDSYAEAYRICQHDIQYVTVLKDAGSTAIYGSRGSNGVVIIRLKTKN